MTGAKTDEKIEYLHIKILNRNKYWNDLLWVMGKGDKTNMDSFLGTDIVDFFHGLRNFQNDLEKLKKK